MKHLELSLDTLGSVTGGADFPGFRNCGPRLYSAGCQEGGMSFGEWSAISNGSRMVNGQGPATFNKWAGWMRQHGYPSKALDRAGR